MKTATKRSEKSKRDLVLDATLKITAEKGFVGTSTANIAEEAGVGMGTIYRYFNSKDDLLSALFNELRTKFINVLVSNYDFQLDPYANFHKLVHVILRYYISHPYEFKYLERYSDSSLKIDQKFNATTMKLEPVQRMLDEKQHGVQFKKLPFFILFAMVYGPLVAIVNLVHMGKIELTDELINQIADSCWDSIVE